MTAPDDPTREQPAVAPTVSTAPAPARAPRWWHAIPRHLGRARTSTVVLGVLFLAIGALYLNVKPDAPTATPSGQTSVTDPAATTGGTTPSPAPVPTTPAPTPSEELPDTEEPTTTTSPTTPTPEETTAPEEPTETVPPAPTDTSPLPEPPPTATPTG